MDLRIRTVTALHPMSARGTANRLRIVVLGYLVRCPLGGLAWHHLQYVMGLARLGHDVLFVEDSGDHEWACYNPKTHVTGPDPSFGLEFAAQTFRRLGLAECWAYHDALTQRWHGPATSRIDEAWRTADLLLNLSGSNVLRRAALNVPSRAYVDTDPAFTQLRHLLDPARLAQAREHTSFFSFGENIGAPSCSIPDDGLSWQPTRQPVVLDAWPTSPGPLHGRLTTVMQWDDDSTLQGIPLTHEGRRYGRKQASFAPYLSLPRAAHREMELALGGKSAPRAPLQENGWHLEDALAVTKDPWRYQDYIRASMAEFSIAKEAYVVSGSGWFSERSAAYLAMGRPVVVQDTGFSTWLQCDAGVLRFSTPAEASSAIADLIARYESHCKQAREIAEQYFSADRVLRELVDRALVRGG